MNSAAVRDPMLPESYRVHSVRREIPGVFTLELRQVEGGAMAFGPGQFNMLYQFGAGEVPISVSGDPGDADRLVHTIRAAGGVTRLMEKLGVGDVIGVRGPYGTEWPVAQAVGRDVVIVAGGIGLAPLRPVVYHLLNHRSDYGRIALVYGTRTPADILYASELEAWRARGDLQVEITVDRASTGWDGDVGVVTNLLPQVDFDPSTAIAMTCGPEIMMRFAVLGLRKRGLDAGRIHVSMERNMKCAIGYCGHCQWGPHFICKDGAVFPYSTLEPIFSVRAL